MCDSGSKPVAWDKVTKGWWAFANRGKSATYGPPTPGWLVPPYALQSSQNHARLFTYHVATKSRFAPAAGVLARRHSAKIVRVGKTVRENRKREPAMADATYQKIQLVGTSSKSLSDAISVAVAKAAEIIKEPTWFEVIEQRGAISHGKVQQFQVTISVGGRIGIGCRCHASAHVTGFPHSFSWPPRGCRAMAGQQDRVVGQGEYLARMPAANWSKSPS